MARNQRLIKALDAVVATTTSSIHYVGDAVRVGILLRAAAITSGNGAFTAKGSVLPLSSGNGGPDLFGRQLGGANVPVVALNMLIDNLTNTNAQNYTRIQSKTVSANGDVMLWLDPNMLLNWLELTVTRTTDGTYSAYVVVETEDSPAVR